MLVNKRQNNMGVFIMSTTVTVNKSELNAMYNAVRPIDGSAANQIMNTINTMNTLKAVLANVTLYYKTSGSVSYVSKLTVNWMELADGTRVM